MSAAETDTAHVAPPAGDQESDRASILAALDEVEPGGTVLFGPGTYLVGEIITVAVPEVTLLGHPNGTTLRGCDPGAFGDRDFAVAECNGLSLTGGHQAVRDLTFEYTWVALILGGPACEAGDCPPETLPIDARTGGHVVEQNTFRYTPNGIRVVGEWSEPAVICDNKFLNSYHAVVVRGRTAHIRDNEISVPEPARVPFTGHPGGALALVPSRITGDRTSCAGNVITGVERRAPFPGNLLLPSAPLAETWREANGSGIWISPGSDGNQIVGNTFEDVAGAAVFLEGADNRVELRRADDEVRDLGSGNEATASDDGGK